ncbi:hypothetical protein ENH_00037620, partial [Eimeria necatrix]
EREKQDTSSKLAAIGAHQEGQLVSSV